MNMLQELPSPEYSFRETY